jgi:hypothetical protein
MPKVAKKKVFSELHKIIRTKLKRKYWGGCAGDAFYGEKGKSATNDERAEAIKNYLKKLVIV